MLNNDVEKGLAVLRFLSDFVGSIFDAGRVSAACVRYFLSGKNASTSQRMALMRLHCATNARSSEAVASVLRTFSGRRTATPETGLLGDMPVDKQKEIAAAIDRDGFYVFEKQLPKSMCDAIEAFAKQTPAAVENAKSPGALEIFNPTNPTSKTYRIKENVVAEQPAVQQLMADPSVLAIAESYLGFTPQLSMLNLWWSATFGTKPGDQAAQNFHFDYDPPPKWLLFFVYLTDVGPSNGPHVFVKGTQKAGVKAASKILRRGYVRIADDEIERVFGADNVIDIHGKCGTVIAVDTRGFHKGKVLAKGHRLMLQLTFSHPAFSGAHGPVDPICGPLQPELQNAQGRVPNVFSRYLPVH